MSFCWPQNSQKSSFSCDETEAGLNYPCCKWGGHECRLRKPPSSTKSSEGVCGMVFSVELPRLQQDLLQQPVPTEQFCITFLTGVEHSPAMPKHELHFQAKQAG